MDEKSTKLISAIEDYGNDIAVGIHRVAKAIRPEDTGMGHDAYGGRVDSLLEAVMGIPHGLKDVADAIREHGSDIKDGSMTIACDLDTGSSRIANAIEKGEKGNAS